MRKILRRLALGMAALLLAGQAAAAPVTVFAAASLKNALDTAIGQWNRRGGEARAAYGASSALARQIEAGAPADLFISADTDWMDWAQKRHLIVAPSRRDIAAGRLVLVAPARSPLRLALLSGAAIARALGDGRLAVAAPEVPAGRYARAALTSLGLWDAVKDRLAPAQDVRAALAFVARGAAPLGIVYESDAKIEPGVRVVAVFPAASHPPIVYPAAVVAASRNPEAASLLAFLAGPPGQAIFRRFGFLQP